MTDREALERILHCAREASKVHWASGNLALIEQICDGQLKNDPDKVARNA